MPRLVYDNGYVYCSNCGKHFKEKDCPIYQSKVQKYPICPECPNKWRVRRRPHNKRWSVYYSRVIRPQFIIEKDIIVKYKWDHPRKRFSNNNKKDKKKKEDNGTNKPKRRNNV